MSRKIKAWWFGPNRLPHGDDREVTVGSRLTVKPPVTLCKHGLHGSRRVLDALEYARCDTLWRTIHSGTIVENGDKLCSSVRTHIARIDASPVLQAFARRCALDVIELWDAPDVVRRYLVTGDESLWAATRAAAGDAAGDAARAAAGDAAWAAWDAARAAAGDAAWDAAAWAAWDAARAAAGGDASRDSWAATRDRYANWLDEMCLEAIR